MADVPLIKDDAYLDEAYSVFNQAISKVNSKLTAQGIIITKYPLNVNTANRTLEFPTGGYIGVNYQDVNTSLTASLVGKTISLNTTSGSVFIAFNTSIKAIEAVEYSADLGVNHVLLGYIIFDGTNGMVLNASYTVDGKSWVADGSITSKKSTSLGSFGAITSLRPVNIDVVNKKMNFPAAGYMGMIYKNYNVSLSSLIGTSIDLPTTNGFFVKMDTASKAVGTVASTSALTETEILLGYIYWSPLNICLPGLNYTINAASMTGLGDSLTWGDNGQGTGSNSISWLAQLPFGKVNNNGIRGARIAVTSGRTDSFVERYPTIPSAEVMSVFGGTNDYQNNVPLGTIDSTENTTFYGALKIVLKGVRENNPDAKIFVITPLKRTYGYGIGPNGIGLRLVDYVSAIKEVADMFSIPVLDLYSMSGISPLITAHVPKYFVDGIHPTNEGYSWLANIIYPFIKSTFRISV